MSQQLFPFLLLGEPRHTETVGSGQEETKATEVTEITVGSNVRDFRPIVQPKDRPAPAIGNKKAVSEDDPKVSSAMEDASSSLAELTASPAEFPDPNADAAKESNDQPVEVVIDPDETKTTGVKTPPAQESTPETPETLTSSSLLL